MTTDDTIQAAYQSMTSALMTSEESRMMVERAIRTRRRVRAGAALGAASLAVIGAVGVAGVVSREGVDSMQGTTPAAPARHDSVIVPPVHIMIQGRPEFGGDLSVPRNPFGPYQNELMRAAERYDNYSGFRIIYQPQTLIVYGTGQPSPEVADIINHPPKDVTARWVTVPYSQLQLRQPVDQLFAVIPRAVVISNAKDYGSIIVGVDGLPTSEAALQELRDLAAGITDIPVTFEDAVGGMVLPYFPSN